MKHSFLLAFTLGLSSCATYEKHQASKAEIETSAKQLIAKREHREDSLYRSVSQDADGTWRIQTHAIDPHHTECGCVLFIPGTGREILFSRSGKLINYSFLP